MAAYRMASKCSRHFPSVSNEFCKAPWRALKSWSFSFVGLTSSIKFRPNHFNMICLCIHLRVFLSEMNACGTDCARKGAQSGISCYLQLTLKLMRLSLLNFSCTFHAFHFLSLFSWFDLALVFQLFDIQLELLYLHERCNSEENLTAEKRMELFAIGEAYLWSFFLSLLQASSAVG